MLISVILLISAGIYKNKVRDSKIKRDKDRANELLIGASVLFVIDIVFLALSVFYQHSYSTMVVLFPIVSFFQHMGSRRKNSMSGMPVGNRSQYFQPISHVGGNAPPKQT